MISGADLVDIICGVKAIKTHKSKKHDVFDDVTKKTWSIDLSTGMKKVN